MARRGFNDPRGSVELNTHLATIDSITGNLSFTGNISTSHITGLYLTTALLTPAAVAAGGHAEQTFNVPGLMSGDVVVATKPSVQTGLLLVQSRVTSTNTLGLTFYNPTAAPITPTQETYLILAIRPA